MNTKTNAMRILDKEKIQYNVITYDVQKGKVDGISVAQMIGRSPESVYKTLVAKSSAGNIYVFVIPVEAELDLKKSCENNRREKNRNAASKRFTKMDRLYPRRLFADRHEETLLDDYRFNCIGTRAYYCQRGQNRRANGAQRQRFAASN